MRIMQQSFGLVQLIMLHLDVKDIEEIYQYINQAGLNTTQDSIHFYHSGKME